MKLNKKQGSRWNLSLAGLYSNERKMTMNWNEFKGEVDRQLEAKGLSGDAELWWIEVSFPCCGALHVDHDKSLGVTVAN